MPKRRDAKRRQQANVTGPELVLSLASVGIAVIAGLRSTWSP